VRRPGSDPGSHGPQVRRIRVNHGYDPPEVHVAAGIPCAADLPPRGDRGRLRARRLP
jgi:hypothetical protein